MKTGQFSKNSNPGPDLVFKVANFNGRVYNAFETHEKKIYQRHFKAHDSVVKSSKPVLNPVLKPVTDLGFKVN